MKKYLPNPFNRQVQDDIISSGLMLEGLKKKMNVRNLPTFFYGVVHMLVPVIAGSVTLWLSHSVYSTMTIGTLAVGVFNWIEAATAPK